MHNHQQFTVKTIALLFLCLFALFSERAQAATVNIADGDVVGLIAAINAANASSGPDTINLAPGGTYTLTAVAEDDGYAGGAGLPYIRGPLTINGNGATIQRSSAAGTPDFRIVYVFLSDLTLNGVTITGGRGGNGNRGGGGIGMIGSNLVVTNSTITGNVGLGFGGGGIGSFISTFTVENSTISNNTSFSGYGGGGILNVAAQTRSTIVSSTIFENQNDWGRGDAIADAFSGPGTMVVKNSVLSSPTRGVSDDCYAAPGVVVSQGHNIAGDGTCSLTGPGDMNSTNPLLGPLANNGGNTPTHALLNGSPAIDAIPLADCTNTAGIPITTDQRGVFRPQGARCDIGSYEIVPSGGPDRYNDRQSFLTALCPTATTKTIDFSRKDDGSFITTPAADTYFETLTLSGVTFHQVQSYYNSHIYYFPTAIIKADLPPNTFSFGLDLSAGYGTAGTFTITLSTGQTYYINTSGTSRFFGVISSTPIEWATFSFNNNYLLIDNFVIGSGCDSTPPTIIAPADSSASADDSCQAAVPDYIAGSTATDDGGSVTLSQIPAAGTLMDLGSHTVTVTAVDGSGNSSSDTVVFTVNDDTPPTLTATPGNIVTNTDAGLCSAVVTFSLPAATDNCSTATVTSSPASGSAFPTGTTTVSVTAIDAAGNTTSHSFTVTVNDQENPTIACPTNINVVDNVPGSCGASVNPGTPVTSDNCGIASVIGTRSDGQTLTALYQVGATTINWVVTDASGNTTSCTQTVTVTNPAPAVIITGPITPQAVNTPVNFTATFTDNAGDTHTAVWTFDGSPQSGVVDEIAHTVTATHTFTTLGVHTVSVTVTDDCGQPGTANSAVLIYAFATAPGNGSFVIGDGNAAVGTQVTFWGAQWWKLNSLSGGAAPSSFKGFANRTSSTPPNCGGTWTTDPGNSSDPPGSIPTYLAVFVSSSITQSGSTISGSIRQMVVVKTNPGYDSNPGHAGTGTVVAVICQ